MLLPPWTPYPAAVAWVVVVAVVLGAAGTAVLLALLLALIRHVRVLAGGLRAFQEEVRPQLDEIARRSAQARERLERISEGGPRRGPDARIRP